MKTMKIDAEETSILSCTLYNHETEIKRQVQFDVLPEHLSTSPEVTLAINFGKQHFLFTGRRVEHLSPNATFVDISGATVEAGEISIIEASPKAKGLYDKITARLNERASLESELKELGESQAALDALRTKIVAAQSDPEKAVDSVLRVSEDVGSEAVQSKSFEKKKALIELVCEIDALRVDIINLCGIYTSADASDVKDALASVTELMTQKRTQYQEHLNIKLNVSQPGKVSFVLCYQVCQAGWLPTYSVHTTTSCPSQIKLTYYALVDQKTVEDWKDVEIAVGTGSAPDSAAPRFLGISKVSYANPTPDSKKTQRLVGNTIHSLPPHSRPAWYGIHHETGGAHALFKLGKHSVPANAGHQKLLITEQVLSASNQLYCSPESDANVYRAAKVKNHSEYLLLPSETASLVCDNSFVAETQMPLVAPGSNFQIYLGRESQINVQMKPLVRTKKPTSGSSGTTDQEEWEHSGWIQNLQKKPVTLMMAFRFPSGLDESIKVHLGTATPKTHKAQCECDLDCGQLDIVKSLNESESQISILNESTQRLLSIHYLKPDEKRDIKVSFVVDKPAGKEISPASSSN